MPSLRSMESLKPTESPPARRSQFLSMAQVMPGVSPDQAQLKRTAPARHRLIDATHGSLTSRPNFQVQQLPKQMEMATFLAILSSNRPSSRRLFSNNSRRLRQVRILPFQRLRPLRTLFSSMDSSRKEMSRTRLPRQNLARLDCSAYFAACLLHQEAVP
jgi:hypothetical protein